MLDQDGRLRHGPTRSRVLVSIGWSRPTFLLRIAEPAAECRVVHDDRLRALGTGGDEANLDADLLREEVDIPTRICRKGTHLGHAQRRALPAWQRRVDRFNASQILRNCG